MNDKMNLCWIADHNKTFSMALLFWADKELTLSRWMLTAKLFMSSDISQKLLLTNKLMIDVKVLDFILILKDITYPEIEYGIEILCNSSSYHHTNI